MPNRSLAVIPLALLAGFALTACEQAKELSQNAASAVAGHVVSEVKNQANQAIDQIASEADQALAPLGIDSSAVASQVKAKAADLAAQMLKAGSDWKVLSTLAGETPQALGLFTPVSPVMPELKALLGEQLPAYLAIMQGAGTLQADASGVLYTLAPGKKGELGWLLIDPVNRKLEAGIRQGGKDQVFASKGEPIARPAALQQQLAAK